MVAVLVGTIVGLTAYFIFQIPSLYSVVLGLSTTVLFFFVILWSSFIFIFN